jgi:DNA-binding transcriptional LysR family regulator
LVPMQHVLCASPAYLEARGTPRVPKDLQNHNCLVLTHPNVKAEWRFAGPRAHARVRVHGNFLADSTEALYVAVLSGLGIARIPNYVVGPELASGRLRRVLSNILGSGNRHEGPAIAMKAYYARTRYPSPTVQALIEHFKTTFKANRNWQHRPVDVALKS